MAAKIARPEPIPAMPPGSRDWNLLDPLEKLAFGDRYWGFGRLLVLVFLGFVLLVVASILFEMSATSAVVMEWRNRMLLLERVPTSILQIPALGFIERGWRYLVVPAMLLVGALFAGARYVQDVYELSSFRMALRYVLAALFGFGYPRLKVSDSKPLVDPLRENPVLTIGGPGYLQVGPGDVVLVERPNGQGKVLGFGRHFINRFERIKEIFSLDIQNGHIEELTAVTRDGLRVQVKDVRFQYHLRTSRRAGKGAKLGDPVPGVPFMEISKAVYHRSVSADGIISWGTNVKIFIESAIKGYIGKHVLDNVIAPVDLLGNILADPRGEIQMSLNSAGFRQRLADIGAELHWIDIGHISVDNEEVVDQILQAWQAKRSRTASLALAEGEARRQAEQEKGRAQAQATIVRKIVESLSGLGPDGEARERLHSLIVLRTVQILESLSEKRRPEDG